MGYYRVFSPEPRPYAQEGYKGLHRAEAPLYELYEKTADQRFLSLWEKECELCTSKNMGFTTELTIDELKEYAELAARETGEPYEVIYFSQHKDCPHRAEYYGLFREYKDAAHFRDVLEELEDWRPGWLEDEDWRVLHIFKVL